MIWTRGGGVAKAAQKGLRHSLLPDREVGTGHLSQAVLPMEPNPSLSPSPPRAYEFVYICEPHNPGAHNPTELWETCQQMDADLGQLLPWTGLETCSLSFRRGSTALGPSETSVDSRNQ